MKIYRDPFASDKVELTMKDIKTLLQGKVLKTYMGALEITLIGKRNAKTDEKLDSSSDPLKSK